MNNAPAHGAIRSFEGHSPTLGANVMIDPSAVVIGDVVLGDDASVWPGCVVRGDHKPIRVGARTNIQDLSVLHITHDSRFEPGGWPLTVGEDVTIGHRAILHGCHIGNRVLVGMGAIIMDGCVVEDDVIIGAGTLVPPGKRLVSGQVYSGSPAVARRTLTDREREFLPYSAENYVRLKDRFLADASTA